MLDPSHAPALLIQHLIVHHAADRQFRILLDRVIFQILIAAVTVHEIPPIRIAHANAFRQRQPHRRALNVQRLVIFHDANRFAHIDVRQVRLNRFQEQPEPQRFQECARLRKIGAIPKR